VSEAAGHKGEHGTRIVEASFLLLHSYGNYLGKKSTTSSVFSHLVGRFVANRCNVE